MRKTIIGIIVTVAGVLLVVGIIGAIVTRSPKPEKLTPKESLELAEYREDVASGILADLNHAKKGTKDIKEFVKNHPNMEDDNFGDGPAVLLDLAEQWRSSEESQNVRPKNTAEVYLFFIDLYPKHEKVPEVKRWLRANDYDVD